jgi:16S rRNA G966 N2-methylase RsmD
LKKIIKNKIKIKKTLIIVETTKQEEILIPDELNLFKEKNYGKTKLLFIN